jgi:hypothetical protein
MTLKRIKKDEVDRACSTHVSDKKYMQSFGQKISRKKTVWKTYTQTGKY